MSTPRVSLSSSAASALLAALDGANSDDRVHVSIDVNFNTGLELGPKGPGDQEVDAGALAILMDAESVKRANGLCIDWVEREADAGFKIDNPNAPAKVIELTPQEFKTKLDAREFAHVLDVRSEHEIAIATIGSGRMLTEAVVDEIGAIADRDTPLGFYCHHGVRSRAAANHFLQLGFRKVYNLSGGIDAWALQVDGSVERY